MKLDKSSEVISQMFDMVAPRYDLMNDLMTGFSHKMTREFALKLISEKPKRVLDLATGTGDFTFLLYEKFKDDIEITGIDFSKNMLAVARIRARRKGVHSKIKWVQGDITSLPFDDNNFDICTIGYGIRYVNNPKMALKEILRVTKPGGTLLIVEATPPLNPTIRYLNSFYFSHIAPLLAKIFSSSSTAYKYFAESVAQFPLAPQFSKIMNQSGWSYVRFFPMLLGSVTVFQGIKSKKK